MSVTVLRAKVFKKKWKKWRKGGTARLKIRETTETACSCLRESEWDGDMGKEDKGECARKQVKRDLDRKTKGLRCEKQREAKQQTD